MKFKKHHLECKLKDIPFEKWWVSVKFMCCGWAIHFKSKAFNIYICPEHYKLPEEVVRAAFGKPALVSHKKTWNCFVDCPECNKGHYGWLCDECYDKVIGALKELDKEELIDGMLY